MEKDTVLTTGRSVIEREAEALGLLAASLGEDFATAVDVMLAAKGRVVVVGMGKSGHIARKIAATLASTGTPAQFVHPGEASHGDLGMITSYDVALVLSNSGETPELSNVIAYTRRFDIPLIGVAARAESTLLRQSDVALILPKAQEVCPMGLAPTTSTTMTLALGDALAVALMEHRRFTPEKYRDFHPGGTLGARLSKVSDLMHRNLPIVDGSTPMSEALLVISQKGFGVVGIGDAQGGLAGIITDGDLRRHMDGLLDLTAAEVMTADPLTIRPDALAEEAVAMMTEMSVTCLFVVDSDKENRVGGILHIHDCLRAGVI